MFFQGVRLVGANVYICLSRKDSLNYLSTYGFYVRGVPVKVVDITHDSVVICLTGVPHYITDSTITMLVSTFGIAIGEVERRFYKGVDTGERYVRLKPRAHTQVPDFVTVGGCKILIRVLSSEEVCPPYTLQSQVRYELLYCMKYLPVFSVMVMEIKPKKTKSNTLASPKNAQSYP